MACAVIAHARICNYMQLCTKANFPVAKMDSSCVKIHIWGMPFFGARVNCSVVINESCIRSIVKMLNLLLNSGSRQGYLLLFIDAAKNESFDVSLFVSTNQPGSSPELRQWQML